MRLLLSVRGVCIAASLAFMTSIPVSNAHADDLIFADVLNDLDPDGNSIRLVQPDGGGLRTLIRTGGGVRGLDVDNAGFIYWTDVDNFVVRRARFDGSAQQDLITSGVAFPSALRIHAPSGQMYWGDQTTEEIRHANLDGSADVFTATTPFFRGLAFDTVNNRVYWSVSLTAGTGRIASARLDGSDEQVAVPVAGSFFKPGNLAIDSTAGKIYWTDAVARVVRRANLDGSAKQTIFDGSFVGPPKGLALDVAAGVVYFGLDVRDPDSDAFLTGSIMRIALNGENPVTIISGLGSVNDIVISRLAVCFADFNGDETVSVQDIFDFLAAYFSNDPLADFNHVGGVTVQDIFDFLAAYFAGCP